MKWFGPPGGAAYEQDCPHVPVPIGQACTWCDEPILADDAGVFIPTWTDEGPRERPYHHECQLRQVIGGLNHLRGRCVCCGGTEPPDPGWLTRRQAARQALAVWELRTDRRP